VNSPPLQGPRQRPLPAALSGSLNKAPGVAGDIYRCARPSAERRDWAPLKNQSEIYPTVGASALVPDRPP
jgi:hypothetical protein